MSINQRSVSVPLPLLLLLLLLSIVAGSIPSAVGQNTLLNVTTGDIVDLVGNITERAGVGGEEDDDDSSFPFLNDDDDNSNSSSISSLPSPSSSSVPISQTVMINEIELNPMGGVDGGEEWIELYNPLDDDINISNFEIRTLSESATMNLPPDAIIEAGETYVIELGEQILSNIVESLVLADATEDDDDNNNILDRTPSLVDMSNDDRTWQRIPDGNNEWQFVEDTEGSLNSPDRSNNAIHDSTYYSESDIECLGSAGCIEGIATRIIDGDSLYVSANSTIYKVDLAFIEAPSRGEEEFVESTAFTRDLCLGSTVLIDQDDKLLMSTDSSVNAVVYCSSSNLNEELLDNGYVELEVQECATSEFANEPWVKDHGC
jgi:endonuclease YncB( thermonuclease family)